MTTTTLLLVGLAVGLMVGLGVGLGGLVVGLGAGLGGLVETDLRELGGLALILGLGMRLSDNCHNVTEVIFLPGLDLLRGADFG